MSVSLHKKAVFLDRDGVINREKGYITTWEDFELLPHVADAIRQIHENDFLVIVITNQSGIAKGLYTEKNVQMIHQQLDHLLQKSGAKIDAYYYCPHHPEGIVPEYTKVCNCRKPDNGMILQAAKDYNIALENSFLIGDSERDILAGRKSGCITYGVRSGHGFPDPDIQPDDIADNLFEAVKAILSLK